MGKIKDKIRQRYNNIKKATVTWLMRKYLSAWQKSYAISTQEYQKYYYFILTIFIPVSVYFEPILQNSIQTYFCDFETIENLRSLYMTLGGALIGAAAISFSFIMFALQVNVERLPHGLFRRFSSDPLLLIMVVSTFIIAIIVTCFSIFISTQTVALYFICAAWGILFIFNLFYITYRRALRLINTTEQLKIIISDAEKDMKKWVKRSNRARPVIQLGMADEDLQNNSDLAHLTYLNLNPHWCLSGKLAISNSISYFHQAASKQDYEGSASALNAIVKLNDVYITSKRKTFFAANAFMDNPLSTDSFFSDTLEHLRKALRASVINENEKLIEQVFHTYSTLIYQYLDIEYPNDYDGKTHAHIAMRYLTDGVKSVTSNNLVEVVMEGIRTIGRCAVYMIGKDRPEHLSTLTEHIQLIGFFGIRDENHHPITLIAMDELTKITLRMMVTKGEDFQFAFEDTRKHIQALSKLFLLLPDPPLTRTHSTYLAPYFSSTSNDTLRGRLTDIVNFTIEADAENEDAKSAIKNIRDWSNQLYISQKELLLFAIERRLPFTHDILFWITGVSDALIAITCSAACDEHDKTEIIKNATWLLSTISWVPDDEETITFLMSFRIEELLFESATEGRTRACEEYTETVLKLLLGFGCKAGQYDHGQHSFEQSLYALSVFGVADNSAAQTLIQITTSLSLAKSPSQEIKNRTAQNMIEKIDRLGLDRMGYSKIDNTLNQVDREILTTLLNDMIAVLEGGQ